MTAAITHLAHSTPPDLLLCRCVDMTYHLVPYNIVLIRPPYCSTDFNSYGPVKIAETTAVRSCQYVPSHYRFRSDTSNIIAITPDRKGGRISAPTSPGLGVEPDHDVLGEAVFDISL